MDPNATIRDIVMHLEDGDREAAADSMDDLLGWLRHDGFLPTLDRATLEFLLGSFADCLRK